MVIINPTSGGEQALNYKEKIENKAKEYFEVVEIRITEKALDATHFAEEAAKEKYEAVIVFGGDGTVNEVISGIAEKEYIPKLGIIPGGTGNLITKLVQIDQDIDISPIWVRFVKKSCSDWSWINRCHIDTIRHEF